MTEPEITIELTNPITGEVVELPASTIYQLKETWEKLQKLEKQVKKAREQCRELVEIEMGSQDEVDFGKRKFIRSIVQYRDYDLYTLRDYIDSDILADLVKPDNKAIDEYLEDNKEWLPFDKLKQAKVATRTIERLELK